MTDKASAYGQGHSAHAVVGADGQVVSGEYGMYDPDDANGDGSNAVYRDIPGMPTEVGVTSAGEPDFRAMEAMIGAFADRYGIDTVDVSHFPEADDIEAAAAEIATVQQEIADGQNYDLFDCNCGDISDRVLEHFHRS